MHVMPLLALAWFALGAAPRAFFRLRPSPARAAAI